MSDKMVECVARVLAKAALRDHSHTMTDDQVAQYVDKGW